MPSDPPLRGRYRLLTSRSAPFCTPTHGCTERSFLLGRVSAYRLHLDDAIPFESSLEMKVDHGLRNSMAGDYTTVAYWYQHEPHEAFPELPPAPARRPRPPWHSPVQWLLVLSVLAVLGAVAVRLGGR